MKINFYSLPRQTNFICRKFRLRKAARYHHLPHHHVKDSRRGAFARNVGGSLGMFSGNLGAVLGDGGSQIFTNLLKTNFLNKTLDQTNELARNPNQNQNLILSDQFSQSAPVAAVKSRVDSHAVGLTAAALNINLSSLGPLYSSRSKDQNSSTRVSRAASPALGNSADNNRLTYWIEKAFLDILVSCFHRFFEDFIIMALIGFQRTHFRFSHQTDNH